MSEFPCDECVCLPSCITKIKMGRLDNKRPVVEFEFDLFVKCSLIRNYIYPPGDKAFDHNQERVDRMADFFMEKYNEP